MTETVIGSASKEVIIGFGRPFVVIGERINPSGRRMLAEEMSAGDYSRVEKDARAQIEAGADMLDVNAGLPMADEKKILAEAVKLVQSLTDVPLAIDSSAVEPLAAGLAVYQGKALVNSVTGEDERLESVLPLVKKYGAAVIGMSHDAEGLSPDPEVRFKAARKIVERAADHGIPTRDVVIDPLVFPIGTVADAGPTVLEVTRRVREELKVNTVCGASNVGFGLPGRRSLNAAFIAMMMAAGLTSAIANPLHEEQMNAIKAADAILGHDRQCSAWMTRARAKIKAEKGNN